MGYLRFGDVTMHGRLWWKRNSYLVSLVAGDGAHDGLSGAGDGVHGGRECGSVLVRHDGSLF